MPPRPQPDPAFGIFETMLVVRGAPVAPAAHLARLNASLKAVYGTSLPTQAADLVSERATDLELGRVRLTSVPSGLEIEAGEIDPAIHFPRHPISLRSHPVSGGLGHHKWADRAALPPSSAREAALLIDGKEALEADRANVFAVQGGAVFTPPLDGRILPGVTRNTVIELAREDGVEVIEGVISLDQLVDSDEVFLTNSIRGIEAVGSIGGARLAAGRPLTTRLVEILRDSWQSETAAPKGGRSLTA
jgi:para-aminobenzoate synthetase/4-amino-4-deoxychorismate lyase